MAAMSTVQSVKFFAPGRTWELCTLANIIGRAGVAITILLEVTSPPGKVPAGGYPPVLCQPTLETLFFGNAMTLGTILIIVLILMLLGVVPTWPHSRSWGYGPSGALGLILVVVIVLFLLGKI
jgi:hypothetical protein